MITCISAILVLFMLTSQSFAVDSTFVQTTMDSLNEVAESKYPFDPAYHLNSLMEFKPLDTVILHYDRSWFDSTNGEIPSNLYQIIPGQRVLVIKVDSPDESAVPYPLYWVEVAHDMRGEDYSNWKSESRKIKKRHLKAIDKLRKKYDKREISDSQYEIIIDSLNLVVRQAHRNINNKYHGKTIGYIGAPELVGKVTPDSLAIFNKREKYVQKELKRIISDQKKKEIMNNECELQLGQKYGLPDYRLEVVEFAPLDDPGGLVMPIVEFDIGMVITVLRITGYSYVCEYEVLVEQPDGLTLGTGFIRDLGHFKPYQHSPEYNTTRRMAWIIAVSAVKEKLSAHVVQTAVFPKFDATVVDSLDNFIFEVKSHFDAQDDFGVRKKTMFQLTVRYFGNDDSYYHNWRLVDFKSWQN